MIRAVICDIYGTLLEVGPAPADAECRWKELWLARFGGPSAPTLREFDQAIRAHIPSRHAEGRARGLLQPEIVWPTLAASAFPVLHRLPAEEQESFFLQHARLCRTTRLAPGAADCLRDAQTACLLLGIASNAQACTRGELAHALAMESLDASLFHPAASFYSYEHGVAKPDPRVFRHLGTRLAALGMAPEEILMVGDRLDADIGPAHAAGWAAWHLRREPGPSAGPWLQLRQHLASA
jgi:FMN phosphatase YigB (HAD superfamily)